MCELVDLLTEELQNHGFEYYEKGKDVLLNYIDELVEKYQTGTREKLYTKIFRDAMRKELDKIEEKHTKDRLENSLYEIIKNHDTAYIVQFYVDLNKFNSSDYEEPKKELFVEALDYMNENCIYNKFIIYWDEKKDMYIGIGNIIPNSHKRKWLYGYPAVRQIFRNNYKYQSHFRPYTEENLRKETEEHLANVLYATNKDNDISIIEK